MENNLSLYRDLTPAVTVFHNKSARPRLYLPHLHSQCEIYYNIEGASGFFADKTLYECNGHDLFIIPPTCVHKVMVKEGTVYERCVVNIDSKIIDFVNATPYLNRPLKWLSGADGPKKVNLSDAQHDEFVAMIDEYGLLEGNELRRHAKLIEILSLIGLLFPIGFENLGKPKQPDSVTEAALVIIEERFKDIRISELSEMLFVSDSHLSKLFKEEYGITLTNYLLIRKIAEAKKYLYMGVSVKEACFLSGFHDYSNFIRTFKNFEGHSPGTLDRLNDPF